jgi:hypothetical protein
LSGDLFSGADTGAAAGVGTIFRGVFVEVQIGHSSVLIEPLSAMCSFLEIERPRPAQLRPR